MRTTFAGIAVVAAVLALAEAAAAGTSSEPEITDPAGDANMLQIAADPLSVAGADLTAVWFDTTYTTEKALDPQTGRVSFVKHVPKALRLHFRTTAPPASAGPTVIFEIRAHAADGKDTCGLAFDLTVRGALSGPYDPRQGGSLSPYGNSYPYAFACDPPTTWPATLTLSGNESVLEFPFATTLRKSGAPVLAPGTVLSQYYPYGADAILHLGLYNRIFVDTTFKTWRYVVGSDVPANVDCTSTPNNSECQ